MTARTISPMAAWTELPNRLRYALGTAVIAGLLLAVGPLLPVVSPNISPGFMAAPLLFVLGLLPAAVAGALAMRGQAAAAATALVAAGLFAPGRLLIDAQLTVQAGTAARPELDMPAELATRHAGTGAWVLLAGQALTLVAAVLAGLAGREDVEPSAPSALRQVPLLLGFGLGTVISVGLIAEPFTSATPAVLPSDALDSPTLVLVGGLLLALAAPLATSIAVTSADPGARRGWLLGTSATVAAIALPRVVVGLAVPGLGPSWGPYVALAAMLAVTPYGLALAKLRRDAEPVEYQLPTQSRLHVAAGILGLVAAGAALIAADVPLLVLPPDLSDRSADRLSQPLIPAAALVAVCAVGTLIPRWAGMVRPALAVAWVGVPLAGAAAFDTALTGAQIPDVGIGPGAWTAAVAMVVALAAAVCAGFAGGVERDDVDLTEVRWRPAMLVPGAVAALCAIGAFGLPLLRSADYRPPGLWSNLHFASWGLALGVLAVIVAALLAPASRPSRAIGLLLGAVGVVGVRLLSGPLSGPTGPGVTIGVGVWLAVATAVALFVSAGVAAMAYPAVEARRTR